LQRADGEVQAAWLKGPSQQLHTKNPLGEQGAGVLEPDGYFPILGGSRKAIAKNKVASAKVRMRM
jgi:hypothetical protein